MSDVMECPSSVFLFRRSIKILKVNKESLIIYSDHITYFEYNYASSVLFTILANNQELNVFAEELPKNIDHEFRNKKDWPDAIRRNIFEKKVLRIVEKIIC